VITRAQRLPAGLAGGSAIPSIDDIVLEAQKGDVDAFERIYRSSVAGVYAVCRRMVADEMQARELTQDAFVRAWERLMQFRGQSSLETWLHRIAVNVVLEHFRRSKRDTIRFIEGDDAAFGSANEPPLDSRMDLASALDKLPAGSRTVLVLHDIEGYSHDEIAQMTGIAPGTARAQLWRARRALSRMLHS
jgi:RNA polymerase sigma-70 factor, ECF subfamily